MEFAIRVATFNIQHGRTPEGAVDAELLARCCVELGADVLALQEVGIGTPRAEGSDLAGAVEAASGMAMAFGEAIAIPGGGRYGNALFVRGALEDVEVLAIPDGFPRSAVLARLAPDRGPACSVAVTHLGLEGRAEAQLPAVLDGLLARPAPRIVLGDLNIEPEVVAPIARKAGFDHVPSAATWPARRPRRTIDHVLLDGFTAMSVEVRHLPVSDHCALVVDVLSDR